MMIDSSILGFFLPIHFYALPFFFDQCNTIDRFTCTKVGPILKEIASSLRGGNILYITCNCIHH